MTTEFVFRDLVAVHFVRAVGEAQRAGVGVGVRQREVVGDAAAAVRSRNPQTESY